MISKSSFKIFILLVYLLFLNEHVQGARLEKSSKLGAYIISKSRGQPFPKPQEYLSTNNQNQLDKKSFSFHYVAKSQVCDVVSLAFNRYYKSIFEPHKYQIIENVNLVSKKRRANKLKKFKEQDKQLLNKLWVNVQEPCEDYPSLESDESCK